MPLYKRKSATQIEVNAQNISNALSSGTYYEISSIKNYLNINGFCYCGTGFLFLGDKIQEDNQYILDGGDDSPIDLIGQYWNGALNNSNDWYNLCNWWTCSDMQIQANHLPLSGTNVLAAGLCTLYINLDNYDWLNPNCLDAHSISVEPNVCVYSNQNRIYQLNLSGSVSLSGVTF